MTLADVFKLEEVSHTSRDRMKVQDDLNKLGQINHNEFEQKENIKLYL